MVKIEISAEGIADAIDAIDAVLEHERKMEFLNGFSIDALTALRSALASARANEGQH